jgi:hypothetical protein
LIRPNQTPPHRTTDITDNRTDRFPSVHPSSPSIERLAVIELMRLVMAAMVRSVFCDLMWIGIERTVSAAMEAQNRTPNSERPEDGAETMASSHSLKLLDGAVSIVKQ